MAQQDRPQRSLRKDGGPRVYRDWSSMDQKAASSPEQADPDAYQGPAPQDLKIIDTIDPEAPPKPPPVVPQEMAPLNVIVPEVAPVAAPEPKKPTITRIDRSKIQRARRQNEIQAEEEAKKEEAAREEAARQHPPEQSPRTRTLAVSSAQTTELQTNMKEIEEKLDEAKENVKTTANAISTNIRQVSDKITSSVIGGIQSISKNLNGLISRFGGKSVQSEYRRNDDDEDFQDEPLPGESPAARDQGLPEPPADYGRKPSPAPAKERNLLDAVGPIPPVMYSALLKEGVIFQAFDKKDLVEAPESLPEQVLQERFVENALQDIRKCIKLVRDLDAPTEGPYAGIPMAYIFKHARDQDLYYFMHYVLSKPDPFRKKVFKISEAFATWLLKRSASTVIAESFPEIPEISYVPLYKDNIRFQTFDKKQLVLASGKNNEELDALFMERALDDVRNCVSLVEKFPPANDGPYKGRPLKQVFKGIKPRDIYFFLHYVKSQPDVFRNQNFKFAEAFASWILKRSHETKINS